jgi:AsmA protein
MKILKLTLITIGVLFLLLLISVVSLFVFVDPNDYKQEIIEVVKKETGRDIVIEKPIKLSIYPYLGLKVGGIKIYNHPSYDDKLFASLSEAKVGVAIIPLLKKEIIVDNVLIKDLKVVIKTNKNGINNYQDLIIKESGDKNQKKQQEKTDHLGIPKIALSGVDIQNVNLDYIDEQKNNYVKAQKCNLSTGKINFNQPINFDFSCRVVLPDITADIKLSGLNKTNLTKQEYALDDLNLILVVEGDKIPNKKQTLQLLANIKASFTDNTIKFTNVNFKTSNVELNGSVNILDFQQKPNIAIALDSNLFSVNKLLSQLGITLPSDANINTKIKTKALLKPIDNIYNVQNLELAGDVKYKNLKTPIKIVTNIDSNLSIGTAQIDKLDIKTNVANISSRIAVSDINKNPVINIGMNTNKINLKNLLTKLAIKLPAMSDKNALGSFVLNTDTQIGNDKIKIKNLKVTLDNSDIKGAATITNLNNNIPKVVFNTNINKLNIDNYLPPQQKKQQKQQESDSKKDTIINLPKDLLRSLKINGNLQVGRLQVKKIKSNKLKLDIQANNGDVNIKNLSFNVAGGSFKTTAGLNVQKPVTRYNLNGSFSNINIEPLLKVIMDEDRILGKTRANFNIKMAGESVNKLKSSLNGKVGFMLKDGAIKGFNLAKSLDEIKTKLKKQKIKKGKKYPQTDFSTASASLIFTDGIGYNKDLNLQAPLLRVGGRGSVNLKKDYLNYLVKVLLTDKQTGQAGKKISQSNKLKIPIKIKGPFANLDIDVRLEDALKEQLQQELDKKKEELKQKLDKKIEQEKTKLKEKVAKEKQKQKDKLKEKIEKEKQKQKDKLKERLKKLF